VLAVIAWIKRRQLRHPELLGIAILVAAAGFVLALGIQLHWLGTTTLPPLLQPFFIVRICLISTCRLIICIATCLSFQNAGDDALRVVHSDLYQPDGGPGSLPVDEIGLLKKSGTGLGLPCWCWSSSTLSRGSERFQYNQGQTGGRLVGDTANTGTVAQFPFDEESSQGQVYNTLVYQKPFLGGYFNSYAPEQYTRIQPVMDTFPSQESVDLLKKLGVTYVVVDSSRYRSSPALMGRSLLLV